MIMFTNMVSGYLDQSVMTLSLIHIYIYLYDDAGVFICGNVPLYYLNWDIVKKKRVFYSNNNTKKMNDYHLISTLAKKGEKMLKDNKLKEKALFVVTTYYVDRSIDINYSLDVLDVYKRQGYNRCCT